MSHTIVLVGHCGIDGPRLQRELSSNLPGVQVTRVNSTGDLERCCDERPDLLLVNREPVGFDEGGVDIIREIRRSHPQCKVMLVSDLPDAQEQAVSAGAIPGFGKSQMGSPDLTDIVKQALAH